MPRTLHDGGRDETHEPVTLPTRSVPIMDEAIFHANLWTLGPFEQEDATARLAAA